MVHVDVETLLHVGFHDVNLLLDDGPAFFARVSLYGCPLFVGESQVCGGDFGDVFARFAARISGYKAKGSDFGIRAVGPSGGRIVSFAQCVVFYRLFDAD